MSLSKQLCKQHKQLTMKTRRRYLMRYNFSIALGVYVHVCVCVCVCGCSFPIWIFMCMSCADFPRDFMMSKMMSCCKSATTTILTTTTTTMEQSKQIESPSHTTAPSRCPDVHSLCSLYLCVCVSEKELQCVWAWDFMSITRCSYVRSIYNAKCLPFTYDR